MGLAGNMNINGNKEVYFLEETVFGQEYDAVLPVQQIKVAASDFKFESVVELLKTQYMNNERKLDEDIASGRITGKLDISKNLDKSALQNHEKLVNTGIGKIIAGTAVTTLASAVITAGKAVLEFTDATNFAVGDFIQVSKNSVLSNFNKIESITSNSVTLKYLVTAADEAVMIATADVKQSTICLPARPQSNKTFQIIIVDNDDRVEVLRGASLAGTMDMPVNGQAIIKFNFQSAKTEYKDVNGVRFTKPTNITLETADNPIVYDFKISAVKDPADDSETTVFALTNDIKIAHTLNPHTHSGGLNNITGWYTEPSITAELMFDNNDITLELFNEEAENDLNNYYFISQSTFAFESDGVKFVSKDRGSNVEKFASITVIANMNHRGDKEPVIILPQ